MADQYDVDISLDPSGYLYGVNQLDQANQALSRSMGGVVSTSSGVSRALGMITPGRATIASMTLLAREAANTEQGMSTLAARSTVTGVSVTQLGKTIRQVARDFPVGYEAAKATVEQFTLMGVAADGSEGKISALTNTVTKLSGATGEGPQQLAAGMTDLARATGNNTLDPKRFERLGDSLTTISASSGASASSILSFSKNIAPMAQAAGIGATGVLGISSAFAKIGEEGIGAQTAVNKMLTDMNRSVREGSPEIKTYAGFVGKSADEFERLFKSNPAEALTQVTEAIAKAGPNGPHMLDQIGIEGVRGQRSIQALVASGGLREGVSQAVAAYGNGSTDKASQAAFGGLNDSLDQLQETLHQTAVAFGQPLLGPLTAFTKALTIPANIARSVISNEGVQKAIQVGVIAGLGVMAAKNIIAPIGALAAGRQMATSSVSRGFFAGLAGDDKNTRAANFGAQSQDLMNRTGYAGVGIAKRPATWAYRFGEGLRDAREERLRAQMSPQDYQDRLNRLQNPTVNSMRPMPNPVQAVRNFGGRVLAAGGQLTAMYGNILNEQYRNARVPIAQRTSTWGTTPEMQRAWQEARFPQGTYNAQTRAFNPVGPRAPMFDAMRDFNKIMGQTTTAAGSFGSAVSAHAKALVQATRLVGALGNDVRKGMGINGGMIGGAARGVAGLGRSMLTGVGGPMGLGMMGTMAIMQANSTREEGDKQRLSDYLGSDIQGSLNAYKESAGEAVSPPTTHAALTASTESLSKSTTTAAGALALTPADRQVADNSKNNVMTHYVGSPSAVAGQVIGLNPGGLSPQVMQSVKVDLARQFDDKTVTSILGQLPTGFVAPQEGKPVVPTGYDRAGLMMTAASLGAAPTEGGFAGLNQKFHEFSANLGNPLTPSVMGTQWAAPREGGYTGNLTPEVEKGIKTLLLDPIAANYKAQGAYGNDYAQQERFKSMDDAVKTAIGSGNVEMTRQLQQQLSGEVLGKDKATYLTPEEIQQEGGGSYIAALAHRDQPFGAQYADLQAKQKAAGGEIKPAEQENPTATLAKKADAYLGGFFDDRRKDPAAQAVAASMNTQGDPGKLSAAVNSIVAAAQAAGKPMADLGVEAAKLASTMGTTGNDYAIMIGVLRRSQVQMQGEQVTSGATDSQAGLKQYQANYQLASMPHSNDPQIEGVRQTAEDDSRSYVMAQMQRMKQRLQVQRDYELQVSRIQADATRSQTYATEDYNRSVDRTNAAYKVQRTEAEYQYQTSVTRAEKDFGVQRARTIRDYNIQAAHAERDMLKERARAIRDFNTQIAREIEDAAVTMLDPYTRIQTKATWDAKNLLVNMQEQTASIAKQRTQLDELRKMGLSAQAIDVLGLGKVENAQQVSNLVADAGQDPKVIGQLSDEAKKRSAAASSLFTDSSNKDLKRQRDDFAKTLKDQGADYKTAVKDNKDALARGLSDSETDYKKTMARMEDDYNHTLSQAQKQLNITLTQMQEDYDRSNTRLRDSRKTTLDRMREDLHRADQTISGDFKTLHDQVMKALNGQAVSWRSVVANDTKQWITDMGTKVLPGIPKLFSATGAAAAKAFAAESGAGSSAAADHNINGSGTAGSSSSADHGYSGGGYHTGGEIPGRSAHEKADDKLVRVTGGEFVHNVQAVREYGTDTMHAINNRSVPKERLVQAVRGFADGGWINPVAPVQPGFPWGHYPSGGIHRALDYPVPVGTPVHAPYSGRIIKSGWSTTGFGNEIEMQNSTGTYSILGHNSVLIAKLGDAIRQGQIVSLSGATGHATGPHVHLEMRTRANDPNSAYNFTAGGAGGAASSIFSAIQGMAMTIPKPPPPPPPTADQVFAKLNQHKGGIYGALRERIKTEYSKKFDDGGIMPPGAGRYQNETGKPERVLTAEQWAGISKLAQVGEHMITQTDLQGVRASAGMHIVINNSGAVTYDNRNDFGGAHITVESQDPDDMARKLEAKRTRQRLTQTRGVRR